MGRVRTRNVHPDAEFVRESITFPAIVASATGQTGLKIRGKVVGYAFEIVRVEVFAKTVTATLSVDVQIGAVSALATPVTPVADTPTAGTLSSTLANKRGTSTEAINVLYTSNGTGAFTGMDVTVWVKPIPLAGQVYSV